MSKIRKKVTIKFKLNSFLKKHGILKSELADMMGVDRAVVTRLCKDEMVGVQFYTLEKLMVTLNCSLDELIKVEEKWTK